MEYHLSWGGLPGRAFCNCGKQRHLYLPGMKMEPSSDRETLKLSLNYFANLPKVISIHFLRQEKLQGLLNLPWGHDLLLPCLLAAKVERGALQRAGLAAQSRRSESCLHPLFRSSIVRLPEIKSISSCSSLHTHTHRKANRISHFIRNKLLFPLHFDFPLFTLCAVAGKWFLSISLSRNSLFFLPVMSQNSFARVWTPACPARINHLLGPAASGSR